MEIIEPNKMPEEVVQLKAGVPLVLKQAQEIVIGIKDQPSIDAALEWCSERKQEVMAVIERLDKGKRLARAAYDEWLNLERDATKPRNDAIAQVKAKAGTVQYQLQESARLDQERINAQDRKEAESKAAKQAARLEKQGEPEMAQAARAAAAAYVPTVIETPKSDKGTVRPEWHGRLKGNTDAERRQNFVKFVAFIGGRPDLAHLLQLNTKELDKIADRCGADCPYTGFGVEFYPVMRVSLAPQRRTA